MAEHAPEWKCPECQSCECSKADLAAYDDEESRAAWADAAWSCTEAQVRLWRERALAAEARERWTLFEDDVPQPQEDVLVLDGGQVKQAWLDGDRGEFRDDDGKRLHNVTHWRPLPAPPEQ